MTFARARSVGRIFAIVLLAWTLVDLVDHDLCANAGKDFPPLAQDAYRSACAGLDDDGSARPDDCFCCSHRAQASTPFSIRLGASRIWTPPVAAFAPLPLFSSSVYRPPIAQ